MSKLTPFKETNPGFLRLKSIKPIHINESIYTFFNQDQIKNYIDTTKYAYSSDGSNTIDTVAKRTLGSLVAEVYTARHMDGEQVPTEGREIDSTDPWQYAYDIVSGPKYSSLRIEVKTSKGPTISVSTKWAGPYKNKYGLNISGFLTGVPDLFLFYYIENNSSRTHIDVKLTPVLSCFRDCLYPETNMIKPDSMFSWVINTDKETVLCEDAFHYY